MTLAEDFRHAFARRRLKDPAYGFLFGPAPADEAVCLDCETSGLDPKTAELLSIGAVRIKGNRVLTSQRLELIVRPDRAVAAEAVKVNHLREADVAGGLSPREAVDALLRFVGGRPLVGYYLEFDVAMVNRVMRPWLGIGLPQRRIEVSGLYYDRKVRQAGSHEYTGNVDLRFATILRDLGIPERAAHDAFNDALMTALIYVKLTQGR